MNLTGTWKGQYTYGQQYPPHIAGTSDPFELRIKDENGIVSGHCIDNVVKAKVGNSSNIDGTFNDRFISFIKTYKYPAFIDGQTRLNFSEERTVGNIHYTGNLLRKFFSRKWYFKGEWIYAISIVDSQNRTYTSISKGTWSMQKVG